MQLKAASLSVVHFYCGWLLYSDILNFDLGKIAETWATTVVCWLLSFKIFIPTVAYFFGSVSFQVHAHYSKCAVLRFPLMQSFFDTAKLNFPLKWRCHGGRAPCTWNIFILYFEVQIKYDLNTASSGVFLGKNTELCVRITASLKLENTSKIIESNH